MLIKLSCSNQAIALKFRLLSIGFTSARSDDERNRDVSLTDISNSRLTLSRLRAPPLGCPS